ncbi:MAG: cellulose synthase subunit BcsC-related outer membrane protein [Candidatus Gastranaerophilales bacterium]|nr:cellulose synthase subunit BcsC-related outer membrane protein [Candidatus Gastranaerophilales bacterium]
MKKLIICMIIFFITITSPAFAFGYKKDYKTLLLKNAINAETRKDFKSAFFNYEKILFYYPQDETALTKYALFCERHDFYDKAIEIYTILYQKTHNKQYLAKIKDIAPKTETEKANKAKREKNKIVHTTQSSETHQKHSEAQNIKQLKKSVERIGKKNNYQKDKLKAKEDLMYKALREKNFPLAERYLSELLDKSPSNKKYINLISGVALAQENYPLAIKYLEKQDKAIENQKILAFSYFKNSQLKKSLNIIDSLIFKDPTNLEFVDSGITYSMGEKDWENALKYLNIGLEKKPNYEKYLLQKADILTIQKQYEPAIIIFTTLTTISPKEEYKLKLIDLYLATGQYDKAELLIIPLYKEQANKEIAQKYLHILNTNEKHQEAYKLALDNDLLESVDGHLASANIARENNDFSKAKAYYSKILNQEPNNLSAQLGNAYASLEKKEFVESRNLFEKMLEVNPSFVPARLGIIDSYMANTEDLKTLSELNKMQPNEKVQILKAKTYYEMKMYENAKNSIKGINTPEGINLNNDVLRAQAYIFNPNYDLFTQKLSEEFKLNYDKIGFRNSKYIDNLNCYTDYNIIIYSSGVYPSTNEKYNNVTNEIRGGIEGRIDPNKEIKLDVGAKIFQDAGAMLNTDSWIKFYPNDKYNLKLGFSRDNVQQSYLSAVGMYLNGIYTGQVANNKVYLEYEAKMPKRYYSFGRGGFGSMNGQNLRTNPYWEGMVGFGNLLYYTPKKEKIKKISTDIVTYNAGYRYNLLDIFDNEGNLYGGYWSPTWFSANTVNITALGEYKKFNYGAAGYVGWQYAINPKQSLFIWGANAFINYKINDHVDVNVAYRYFNYADVQRNQFIANVIIRGFRNVKIH